MPLIGMLDDFTVIKVTESTSALFARSPKRLSCRYPHGHTEECQTAEMLFCTWLKITLCSWISWGEGNGFQMLQD